MGVPILSGLPLVTPKFWLPADFPVKFPRLLAVGLFPAVLHVAFVCYWHFWPSVLGYFARRDPVFFAGAAARGSMFVEAFCLSLMGFEGGCNTSVVKHLPKQCAHEQT